MYSHFPNTIGKLAKRIAPQCELTMCLLTCILTCALSCLGTASAAIIVSTVGDVDALGTATLPGGALPNGPFDNRSAAEMLATDGSEHTDQATQSFGYPRDVTFTHTYTLGPGMFAIGAVLELGIGGLQSNDTDPETFSLGEDALFFNGWWVPEAFAGVNQSARGYGILSINLPIVYAFMLNLDTTATFTVDLNSNAGGGPSSRVEPVFYDYSRLIVTTMPESEWFVPEPASMLLLGGGMAVLLLRKGVEKQRP
jgi:hypothetical protein